MPGLQSITLASSEGGRTPGRLSRPIASYARALGWRLTVAHPFDRLAPDGQCDWACDGPTMVRLRSLYDYPPLREELGSLCAALARRERAFVIGLPRKLRRVTVKLIAISAFNQLRRDLAAARTAAAAGSASRGSDPGVSRGGERRSANVAQPGADPMSATRRHPHSSAAGSLPPTPASAASLTPRAPAADGRAECHAGGVEALSPLRMYEIECAREVLIPLPAPLPPSIPVPPPPCGDLGCS